MLLNKERKFFFKSIILIDKFLTLGTFDNSQKSLFRIENGSKLRSISPFGMASFRTSTIHRRIISRRSFNGFFPTFSF